MPGNRNTSMPKPPVKSRLGFQRPRTNQNNGHNNRPRKVSDRLGYPRNNFPDQFVESGDVFDQYEDEGGLDLNLIEDQNADYDPFPLRVTDRLGGPLARKRTERFRDDADNVLVANVGRQLDGRSVRFGDESRVGNGFLAPASTDLRHNIIAKRLHQQPVPTNGDLRNRLNHMRHDSPISPDAPDARERIMDALAHVPVNPDHDFGSHGFRPLKIKFTTATPDPQRHIQINPDSPSSDMGVYSQPAMKSTMASRLGPVQGTSSAHVPNESHVKPRGSAMLVQFSVEKRSPDHNGRTTSRHRPVSPVKEEPKRPPARKRKISPPSSDKAFNSRRAETPVENRRPQEHKRKITPPSSDRGSPQQRHIADRMDRRYASKLNASRKEAGRRRERSASPPLKRRTTKPSAFPVDRSVSPLPKRRITRASSSPVHHSTSPPPKRRTMKSSPAPVDRFGSPIVKRRTANISPTPVNRRQDTRRRVSPVFDDKPSASQRRPVVKSKQEVSGRTRPQTSANVRNVQPPTSRGRDEGMYRGNAVRREKPDGMVRKEKEDVIRKEKRRPVSPPRRKEPSRAVKPVVYDRVSSSSNVSSAGSNRRGHRDDRSLSDVSGDELDDTDNMSDQSSERQENRQQDDLSDQEDGRGRRYSREELEYEEVNSESEGIEDSRVDVDDSRVDEVFDNISPGEERDWEDEEDYQRQEPKKPRQHRPAPPEEESDEEIDHYEVSTPDQRNRRNVNAGGKRAEAEHVRLSVSESVYRRGADVDHNVTNTFITGDTGLAGLGGGAMGMSLPAFPPMPLGFPQFSSYRMSMNMSMPLMSLPHSLSVGGPAQFLRLPSPRMMGTTPPMISLTPHDIHQHLAMFQQQQHQNQVQQQHQLSIQQQHQLPVQHQNPARNQEQLPTGTRIKPPVSQRIQLETVQEKQTEGKREEVEQRPQSSQQQKSSTVTIPVRLQQIRLKPPQSNLKPIALTATSPNADAAGRGSPVEPVSASSSTNGRDSTNQAKAPTASPSKAADGPSRTITFKKTEKRAAANKTVNLEMDASFASGSPPPNWSMIPVAVDHKAYSHRGQIDLGVFDWDLLESDPRLSVYCQRASVSMPVKPLTMANVTAVCVSSTASAPPEAAVTSSALQVSQSTDAPRNVTSENALPSVKTEPGDSGSGLVQPIVNVMIKQEPLSTEDLKVKEEISDDAAVGPVLTGDRDDVKPLVKKEPSDM